MAAPAPSLGRQKAFIVENTTVLNREAKMAILSVVLMEIGPSVATELSDEVDIDLDAVAAQNPDVLRHIYNIVRARLEALSQPART